MQPVTSFRLFYNLYTLLRFILIVLIFTDLITTTNDIEVDIFIIRIVILQITIKSYFTINFAISGE